ncbi:MAG: hypothetical protein QM831_28495 [Kofleriaceae bacterium]
MMRLAWVALVVFGACGDNKKNGAVQDGGGADAQLEGFQGPQLVCPGGSGCASTGDGVLKVGVSKRTWTPQNFETYTDENMDRQWQTTEPYTDLNGNGKFDAVWLFGGGRAAERVETDVEARAIAFVEGDVSVVVIYNDCIGMLQSDMDDIRNDPRVAALNIDHIIIGSTHAHDAPDIVGLWGPDAATTGRQKFVVDALKDADAQAIVEAYNGVVPATMTIASTKLLNDPNDPNSKTDFWNKDIRDPVIFDPTLTVARFNKTSDGSIIGTLVNWADHPEVAHFDDSVSAAINAHYPHWIREGIENGVKHDDSKYAATDLPGIGGITVFMQGALGGQIGSIRGAPVPGPGAPAYTAVVDETNAKDKAIGTNVAAMALNILTNEGEDVTSLPLSMISAQWAARIDNTLFQVAFLVGVVAPHPLIGYDPNQPIDVGNTPWLPLRSTYLQIGPLGIVTAPGELHPELWVGGYDGSWSWGWPLLDHAGSCSDTHADCNEQVACAPTATCVPTPNLPDFSMAPKPPYMRDLVLAHTGVRYPVLAGLAEDYVGYIVPAYNYVLSTSYPYVDEADGDHYEEVYSLGPLVEQHAIHPILQMLQYKP